MSWWSRLLRGGRLETRLDAELRDHLERQVADYVRDGLSEAEARRRANLTFGGLEQVKEECRDVRGTRWVEDLAGDLRYGARVLRQAPAFTLVAVCSLGLGIGANSAMFSLVDNLLLKSLPVHEPERLVLLDEGSWTNPIWEQIRERETQLFEGATAWSNVRFDLSRGGQTEFVAGLWVSGRFFEVLGVPAILGRTFTALDDRRDGGASGPVAVISHTFWRRHFGGAPDVIGRSITLDRVAFTIVGVTRPGFFGPDLGRSFDVAVPLGTQAIVRGAESWLDKRSTWVLEIMARLKPGQTAETATSALRAIQPRIREATIPPNWSAKMLDGYLRDGLTLVPAAAGPTSLRTRYERPLLVIMAVVALVLLIACANIANLLLARAAGRQHEFSMRLALGASRLRLARQLLVESLLLACLGALAGLAFAQWSTQLIVRQLSTPRETITLDTAPDWRALAFTAAVAIGTALLFGIAPAFRAGRASAVEALKEQSRTMTGGGRVLGSPLVVLQVALSLVLVVAAGLFVGTFTTLATRDLGFDPARILVVSVDTSRSTVAAPARAALYDRILQAVAAVPGVANAGISEITPVSGAGWNGPLDLPELSHLSERERLTSFNAVTPGWFATYGTAIRAGRDFDARDRAAAPAVAIVNEAFARKFMTNSNPVGRTIRRRIELRDTAGQPVEIVGLVEDAAYRSVRDPVPPIMYVPVAQEYSRRAPSSANFSVRAAGGPPALLAASIAQAVGQVDGDVSVTFRTLGAYVDGALVRERLLAILSGFFGALALLLAGIGLYGMTSYAVGRRRAEIGIRMALGAGARRVVWLVLGRVAVLVGLGVALGAALSLWASRFIGTLLYGVEARDPMTFVGAALTLGAVGALAAWLPARRAARIDPARVLRET
jgi:putative ABC transport system permease protein